MPVIVVAGSESGAGATTVAVGLAHRLAYAGHSVRIERLDGDARAAGDAYALGLLEFAQSSGAPVAEAAVSGSDGVTVVEASPSEDAVALASTLGARLLLVGREAGGGPGADNGTFHLVNHARSAGALRLPEDRLLAAPTVGALIEASRAQVLARSELGERDIIEHIVVSPIASDANDTHFARYPRKAVVTRSEKVDSALAALRTDTRCLILSGGSDPSPYVVDRVASDRRVTLLLAPEGTIETVRDIEGTFGRSAFSGEEKVERAGALLRVALDDTLLAALLG
jgi:BioD-like phosphotransacetylase family protein